MDSINDILNSFETIGLTEIENVKLMDRTDRKFSFSYSRLSFILTRLSKYYNVLNVEDAKIVSYKTLYFDTKGLDLYLAHHNQRANRYKIRHRSYVESNLGFMEVKFKNSKDRTIKRRIEQNKSIWPLSDEAKQFISENSNVDPELLKPSLSVSYQRITLVGENERVTIDFNIGFEKNNVYHSVQNLVVAEVKQNRKNLSPVFEILKEESIRESSISKYSLGIISLLPGIKQNNFRQKVRFIKKITNC